MRGFQEEVYLKPAWPEKIKLRIRFSTSYKKEIGFAGVEVGQVSIAHPEASWRTTEFFVGDMGVL